MPLDPSLLLDALVGAERPFTAEEAIEEFGGGAPGRSRLAQQLAGTDDKKSKAYKSAMRSLQRYGAAEGKQRRKMGAKLRPLITKATQTERAAKRLKGPLVAVWDKPLLLVSSDMRFRDKLDAELSDEELEAVRELLEEGDAQGAVDALAAISIMAYMQAPGGADGQILDARRLRFEPA